MIDYQEILDAIYVKLQKRVDKGKVASYIPELANVPKEKFGIYLNRIKGENFCVGDWDKPFSIQSISKVLSFAMAFARLKNQVFRRLDVEPSGNPFNHLSLLEMENGMKENLSLIIISIENGMMETNLQILEIKYGIRVKNSLIVIIMGNGILLKN